jgi:hypothetical protein
MGGEAFELFGVDEITFRVMLNVDWFFGAYGRVGAREGRRRENKNTKRKMAVLYVTVPVSPPDLRRSWSTA